MAGESTRGRWNKNIKGLVEAIDFLLIPTSLVRHVRNLDREGLTSRTGPYILVAALEVIRLGLLYKVVAEPIYNAIVNQ